MNSNATPIQPILKNGGKQFNVFPTLLGALSLFLISVIATQYLAQAFSYQSALGPSLWGPIYFPFNWIQWFWQFRDLDLPEARHHFNVALYILVIGGGISTLIPGILMFLKTGKDTFNVNLHGSARFATEEEVRKSGFLDKEEGVYVGAFKSRDGRIRYLRHNGPEHILAAAPTRSGKGVGLVLPTLLSWAHSALIYDIKGENYALTAGWRQSSEGANNTILKFEPTATDGSSVSFNPLEEVRLRTKQEVSDVQNLVTMIVDPDGKGLNDHWAKTGSALLTGAVLHVLYCEKDKTLAGVAGFLSDPSRSLEETFNYMLQTSHDPELSRGWVDVKGKATATHPVVAGSARDMLNKSENERSGVLSTAMSFLALYRDPIVAENTKVSHFKVADLMNAEKPVSLYLVVSPSDKDRLKPLTRLVLNQIIRRLTEKMEFKDGRSIAGYKHRLLLMIDEFPSLGKLDILRKLWPSLRGTE